MKVQGKMNTVPHIRADGVTMTDFFGEICAAGEGVTMGHAVFPPGTVVPPASHTGDEYAYILSGRIKCISNGETYELCAGEASFIPAGEVHSSINDSEEETILVWMLIEKR